MSPLIADGLLILVTLVWGSTFVVVKNAVETMGALTFIAVRFFIAGIALLVWYALRPGRLRFAVPPSLYWGGLFAGLALCFSYIAQTLGLITVSAGKAAFITGLYVVIVPVASRVLFKTASDVGSIVGVTLAALGLGLLSLTLPFSIAPGDFLLFLCSIGFAAHILIVGVYGDRGSPVLFSAVQLLVVSVICFFLALVFERPLSVPRGTWGSIVYMALAATSFAFLTQSAVQRFTSATHTALIFSAEPVFGALFAWLATGETLSSKELAGAAFVLLGMLVSEAGVFRQAQSRRTLPETGKDMAGISRRPQER